MASDLCFPVAAEALNSDDKKVSKIVRDITVQALDQTKGTTSAAIVFTMGADLAENAAPKAVTASGFNKGTKVDTTVGKYNQDGTTVRSNRVDERNGVVDGNYTDANTV